MERKMTYTVAKSNQLVDPDDVTPVDGIVDLRSDTVTRPSEEMRRAMAKAEVGDDVYGEDPTVNRLQKRAAEIFGKEAALFVPSGCMGNLIAIKCWTHHGNEVICEERSHVNLYELASMAAIAGCMPRAVRADDGIMTWKQIQSAIRPKIYYDSQTALVCLENTSNMASGTVYPTDRVDEIGEKAHALGLKVHLDGARIFNASVSLKEDVASMTKNVDSVMFSATGNLLSARACIARCLAAACVRSASLQRPAWWLSKRRLRASRKTTTTPNIWRKESRGFRDCASIQLGFAATS
jgi:threonine aldolase